MLGLYTGLDCEEEYIGELSRTFGERSKEYLKAPSSIYEHQSNTGHKTTLEGFSIVYRERHSFARSIKESIYIRVNTSTLNRNIGKYNLPPILYTVLFTILELSQKQMWTTGVPGTQHHTSVSYKKYVEKRISRDTSTPRRIMEEKISCGPSREAILLGRQKLFHQGKIFCFMECMRTYVQYCKKTFINDALSKIHIEAEKDIHDVIPLKFLQYLYTTHIYHNYEHLAYHLYKNKAKY